MVGLTITKHDRGGAGEYQAHLADSDAIGRLTWVERDGVHIADHTLVPPEIGGKGVAARLVEAHLADSAHVGRLTWVERDGVHIADHTLVPPEIGGKGVAARLVEALVADARENGFKIEPMCSYVAVAFKRHPEWEDVRA